MLTNKDFIEWASENVVVLVGHNDAGHEPVEEEGEDGQTHEVCPLYPGLTCRQHRDLVVDLNNSRLEELPRVEFVSLQPNSWLVSPRLEVRRIPEEDQFTASKIEDAAAALQKELGTPVAWSSYRKMKDHLAAVDAAMEKADWKAAVAALARAVSTAKEPKAVPEPLSAAIQERIDGLDVRVKDAWKALRDGPGDAAAKSKAVSALRASASGKIGTKITLPVIAEIDAWLAAQAAAR